MFVILIKLVSFGFSHCKKIILILIQTFSKVLVLTPIVSLPPLSDGVNDRKPRYLNYVAA